METITPTKRKVRGAVSKLGNRITGIGVYHNPETALQAKAAKEST